MRDAENKGKKPTQQLLPIREVRDGIVILFNGTMRASLLVSSINFALKSEDEQNAIIFAYQDFLNSLDFSAHITVMSRRLDIMPYLEGLRMRMDRQENELLRLQMNEYINFVSELVKGGNIMTKTFMVTVSFSAQQSHKENLFSKLSKTAAGIGKKGVTMSDKDFDHYKKQLLQRAEQVAVGLRNIGLRVAPLQTQEILEMYYTMLNPVTSRNQRLQNVAELATEETSVPSLVSKQTKRIPWVNSK